MEDRVCVRVKVLPPFTANLKGIETVLRLEKDSSLLDLFNEANSHGILRVESIIDGDKIRENVVILVNGRTTFDLKHRLSDGDRVVVMPLAPGG